MGVMTIDRRNMIFRPAEKHTSLTIANVMKSAPNPGVISLEVFIYGHKIWSVD